MQVHRSKEKQLVTGGHVSVVCDIRIAINGKTVV